MTYTGSIQELGTTRPDLYAFAVWGEVNHEDMQRMAGTMNNAFDAHDHVDVLHYFEDFQGSVPDAQFDAETVKSQFRALSSVRRYVVANAPEGATGMVETTGKVLPVEAESFDSIEAAYDALDTKRITTA